MLLRTRFEELVKGQLNRLFTSSLLGYLLPFFPYQPQAETYCIEHPRPGATDPQSGFAIPPRDLWLGYARDADEYLRNGQSHTGALLEHLRAAGGLPESGGRALDFGCGAGRMLRWLVSALPGVELWGVDVSARHIVWARQHLSPPVHFLTATLLPHLPFADSYFDLIYASSVFTHIDDLTEAWLMELRRILRVGGRLYLTIHDQHTIQQLRTERWRRYWLARYVEAHKHYDAYTRAPFRKFTIGRSVRSYVFYDTEHFCQSLQPFFRLVAVERGAFAFQTALLFEKVC
jgi:SAM-dependent methyltransferase